VSVTGPLQLLQEFANTLGSSPAAGRHCPAHAGSSWGGSRSPRPFGINFRTGRAAGRC